MEKFYNLSHSIKWQMLVQKPLGPVKVAGFSEIYERRGYVYLMKVMKTYNDCALRAIYFSPHHARQTCTYIHIKQLFAEFSLKSLKLYEKKHPTLSRTDQTKTK